MSTCAMTLRMAPILAVQAERSAPGRRSPADEVDGHAYQVDDGEGGPRGCESQTVRREVQRQEDKPDPEGQAMEQEFDAGQLRLRAAGRLVFACRRHAAMVGRRPSGP